RAVRRAGISARLLGGRRLLRAGPHVKVDHRQPARCAPPARRLSAGAARRPRGLAHALGAARVAREAALRRSRRRDRPRRLLGSRERKRADAAPYPRARRPRRALAPRPRLLSRQDALARPSLASVRAEAARPPAGGALRACRAR